MTARPGFRLAAGESEGRLQRLEQDSVRIKGIAPVSGPELLEGMRALAERMFGPLAAEVWRSWGVYATIDWGRIVFVLVDAKLLNRQESDTLDQFKDVFDFAEAFELHYAPQLPTELGANPLPDEG